MLVQVQHQRERDGLDEDEAQTKPPDKKQRAIEGASDAGDGDQVKKESNTITGKDDGTANDQQQEDTNKSEQNDVEMKDVENSDGSAVVKVENKDNGNETEIVEADSHEKDLTIDPRTYCTLGHFQLLLEDYAKGTVKMFA